MKTYSGEYGSWSENGVLKRNLRSMRPFYDAYLLFF